jgi:hypothetical protein
MKHSSNVINSVNLFDVRILDTLYIDIMKEIDVIQLCPASANANFQSHALACTRSDHTNTIRKNEALDRSFNLPDIRFEGKGNPLKVIPSIERLIISKISEVRNKFPGIGQRINLNSIVPIVHMVISQKAHHVATARAIQATL